MFRSTRRGARPPLTTSWPCQGGIASLQVYLARSKGVKWVALVGLLLFGVAARPEDQYASARDLERLLGSLTRTFEAGRPDSVVQVLDELEGRRQLTGRLYNLRGLSLDQLGRGSEAIESFEKGLALAYERPELHANLAVTLLKQGATGRAMAEFEEAIRLDPRSVEAQLGYGRLLRSFRRWDPAQKALDRAHELAPDDGRIQWERAELSEAVGDTAAAIEVWSWFEEHDPTAESARRMGRLRPGVGEAEWYLLCVERDPNALDCRERAAEILLGQGKAERARDLLQPHVPDLTEAGLQNLYLALQRLAEATALEDLAVKRPPRAAGGWGIIALSRRQAGQLDQALTAIESASELAPEDLDLANLRGVILYELGRRDEARRGWEAILDRNPHHSDARRNLDERFPR